LLLLHLYNKIHPYKSYTSLGKGIEAGAKAVLDYLEDDTFNNIPLSTLPAGENGIQEYHINNYSAIYEQLSRFKDALEKEKPSHIQTIGGDCGLEIVPVSYLNMPLRTLLGEGESKMNPLLSSLIAPSQIHYVGLRDIDKAEQERLDKDTIYHPKQLNIEDLVSTLSRKRITHLYLHFDFDCLEPTEYPETYYQVPHYRKILKL